MATRLFDSAYDKEAFAQNSATKSLLASYLMPEGKWRKLQGERAGRFRAGASSPAGQRPAPDHVNPHEINQ